jgi:deoxyribonucleoside regulator
VRSFSSEEFLKLARRGVVGDVCFHFLDKEGAICLAESSARVVGIVPEQLKNIPKTIGVVSGGENVLGVAAALRGGYLDTLVCDKALAEALAEK